MRPPYLPPPPLQELESRTLHELLRDYPELLEWVAGWEGALPDLGVRELGSLGFPAAPEPDAVLDFLAWRERLPGEEP